MRQYHIHEAFARAEQQTAQKKFDEKAMNFWVENFGSQAASWLVWAHRRQLHLYGAVDFLMPRNIIAPPWFRIALEKCKRNPKQWEVSFVGSLASKNRTYRLRWLRWGDFQIKSLVEV